MWMGNFICVKEHVPVAWTDQSYSIPHPAMGLLWNHRPFIQLPSPPVARSYNLSLKIQISVISTGFWDCEAIEATIKAWAASFSVLLWYFQVILEFSVLFLIRIYFSPQCTTRTACTTACTTDCSRIGTACFKSCLYWAVLGGPAIYLEKPLFCCHFAVLWTSVFQVLSPLWLWKVVGFFFFLNHSVEVRFGEVYKKKNLTRFGGGLRTCSPGGYLYFLDIKFP